MHSTNYSRSLCEFAIISLARVEIVRMATHQASRTLDEWLGPGDNLLGAFFLSDRTEITAQLGELPAMKGSVVALLLLGFMPAATHATVIDLSMMTCQEFLASNKDEIRVIWAWLDGYYKEEQDPPVINTETMNSNFKKLDDYCSENPASGLITATNKVFGR